MEPGESCSKGLNGFGGVSVISWGSEATGCGDVHLTTSRRGRRDQPVTPVTGTSSGESHTATPTTNDLIMARLEQDVAQAAKLTAENLVARGIASEARAEGVDVYAKVGRYVCIIRNQFQPGPPRLRQMVEEAYVNLVIRTILDRDGDKGSSE